MASADVESLKASRSNLIQIVEAQTAAWVTQGCPPSLSIDGESYSWNEWLASKTKAVEDLTALIQRLSSPFLVRSRGRG